MWICVTPVPNSVPFHRAVPESILGPNGCRVAYYTHTMRVLKILVRASLRHSGGIAGH